MNNRNTTAHSFSTTKQQPIQKIFHCLAPCADCTGSYVSEILGMRLICCCHCHMKSKDLAGLSHSVNVDQSNRQAATQYLNEMDKEEILQGASSVTSLKECQAEAPIGFTRTGGHLMDSMNTRPLCFTPESYQEVTYCTKDPDSIYVNESLINLLGTKCTHFEQKEVRGLMVATRPQHQSQPVVVTNQLPEPEKGDDRTSGRYD